MQWPGFILTVGILSKFLCGSSRHTHRHAARVCCQSAEQSPSYILWAVGPPLYEYVSSSHSVTERVVAMARIGTGLLITFGDLH